MMPLNPEPINTRKMALIAELGYDPNEATEDDFNERGFVLIGEHEGGTLLLAHNELVKTRIAWPDQKWVERALRARQEDFNETFQTVSAPDDIKFYAECIRRGDDPDTVLRTALTRQRADLVADIEGSRPVRDGDPYRDGIHAGLDRAIYRIQHPPVDPPEDSEP